MVFQIVKWNILVKWRLIKWFIKTSNLNPDTNPNSNPTNPNPKP